jgi:DNA modification methylase
LKPYYEHGGITIYHGDCQEILPTLRADAAITDPPYNVGLKYGAGTNDARQDYEDWCRQWFHALRLSVSGSIAISCGQSNLSMWAGIAPPTWWLAWWKPAAMGRCVIGFNNWEPIAVYGKPYGTHCDVIRATIRPDTSVSGHPCPKPMEWATKQVQMFSKPDQLVIDCFGGTGTTLVAASRLGRRAIGIEIEERYCEIAAKRLSQEVLPLEAVV